MSTFKLFQLLKQSVSEEKPASVATVIASEDEKQVRPGAKLLVLGNETEGTLGDSDLDKKVVEDAALLLEREQSKTLTYAFAETLKVNVYIESVLPPTPLVIIGGDTDSVPIVKLAKELGFKVVLVDHRDRFASATKYPDADQLIVSRPEDLTNNLQLNNRAFVLVKTHNYLQDKEILKAVLKSDVRYVGQLGPKARAEDLLSDLEKEGLEFTANQLEKFYAPVGLDIGAETPEQIATSILAEILAVKSGRSGGMLRHQTEAIHPRE